MQDLNRQACAVSTYAVIHFNQTNSRLPNKDWLGVDRLLVQSSVVLSNQKRDKNSCRQRSGLALAQDKKKFEGRRWSCSTLAGLARIKITEPEISIQPVLDIVSVSQHFVLVIRNSCCSQFYKHPTKCSVTFDNDRVALINHLLNSSGANMPSHIATCSIFYISSNAIYNQYSTNIWILCYTKPTSARYLWSRKSLLQSNAIWEWNIQSKMV